MQNASHSRRSSLRRLFSGRNLLFASGIGYIPAGIVLALLSWDQTKGPYSIGSRYPYGGLLEAWQVSNAFAFISFGLLFVAIVHSAIRLRSHIIWGLALAAFTLMWFPHLYIGITFFLADHSLQSLRTWIPSLPFILVWMTAAIIGFVFSWNDICETRSQQCLSRQSGLISKGP